MITEFKGEYAGLSNMHMLKVPLETPEGFFVPTSEHAYMVERFEDPEIRQKVAEARGSWDNPSPKAHGEASKRIAYEFIELGAQRLNWDNVKLGVMETVVRQKFIKNLELAEVLLATGDEELVEGNAWGDKFWGVSPAVTGEGQNHLGKIIMQVRNELRGEAAA